MPTTVQPVTERGARCAEVPPAAPWRGAVDSAPLFPPKDADAETRRRWVATSPWPEVVFACAV